MDIEREAKMASVLDRIPENWGKYLPMAGWDNMLLQLDTELAVLDPDYVICQAKEKFGTLRFYVQLSENLADDVRTRVNEIVGAYEVLSSTICELCGSTEDVKSRNGGWIKTLCDKCARSKDEGN